VALPLHVERRKLCGHALSAWLAVTPAVRLLRRGLGRPEHCQARYCHMIEAPWLVNGGHGASFRRHDERGSAVLRRRSPRRHYRRPVVNRVGAIVIRRAVLGLLGGRLLRTVIRAAAAASCRRRWQRWQVGGFLIQSTQLFFPAVCAHSQPRLTIEIDCRD
jgi:hypothetical protein